jgi:hypothetical protein
MAYIPYQNQSVPLDPSWPGLDAPSGEIRVDPATLRAYAGELNAKADELEGQAAGTPTGLQTSATPTDGSSMFGRWPTAVMMEYSLDSAREGVASYYRLVVGQLRAAAALFEATADTYEGIDQSSQARLEAAGWDQITLPADAHPASTQAAGQFSESAEVPYIDQYENVENYDPQWILDEINYVQQNNLPGQLSTAGQAFEASGTNLTDVAETVKGLGRRLDTDWRSETSVAAQYALRRIEGTARHLGEASTKVAEFARRSSTELQTAVSSFPDVDRSTWESVTDTLNPFGDPAAEGKANEVRDALARLNEAYRDTNYTNLPPYVNANLPILPNPDRNRTGFETGGSGGGGGGISGAGAGYTPPSRPTMPVPPTVPTAPVGGESGAVVGPSSPGGVGGSGGGGTIPGISGVPGPGTPGAGELPGAGTDLSGGLAGAGAPGPAGGGFAGGAPAGAAPGGIGAGGVTPGGVGAGAGPAGGGIPGAVGPGGIVAPGAAGAGGRGATGGAAGRGAIPRASGRGGAIPGVGGAGGVPGRTGGGVVGAPVGGAGAAGGRGATGGRTSGPGVGGRPGATGGGVAGGRPGVAGGGVVGAGGAGGRTGAAGGAGGRAGGPGAGAGGRPGAPGTGAGGRGAAGMMPMAGAGRGKDKESSQHDSWLVEDDDPWRGDEEAPPPVIR